MTLRDLILKGPAAVQTADEAKASVMQMLSGPSIVDGLRRMREGHAEGQGDFYEHSLTHAEFRAAVSDGVVRKRLTELATEGICAQFFDTEQTHTGIRGKSLKLAILPFPTPPRHG